MPEGPEVAVVRDYLRHWLVGNQILALNSSRKLPSVGFPLTVERVDSLGKNLIITCSTITIYCHLVMEGRWYDSVDLEDDKHRLVAMTIGRHETFLTYLCLRDTRHFAKFELLTPEELDHQLRGLGPDVLQAGLMYRGLQSTLFRTSLLTWDLWQAILNKHPKMAIGKLLNSQEYVAGIGNYLRAEILYRSRISPWRLLRDLTEKDRLAIYKVMLDFIVDSYLCQGHSLFTFTVPQAIRSDYTKDVPLLVYGKEADPEGHVVERRKMGQTMHWVPAIQV